MKNRGLLLGASLLALTAVDVGSAYAQIDEIIVTARKREESLQNVPVSVSAFSGQKLVKLGLDQVEDISDFTPGLLLRRSNGNDVALNLSLRGQYQNDVLATFEPSVGTYVDELYWARAYGLNTNLVDIEQVQVLRGPQGTLFGQNTTGGAILFTTADPNFDGISGKVSATYGRFDEATASAVLNLPIIDNVLAFRGAFEVQQRDGYITDLNTAEKYNQRDVATGRIKALWQPIDILTIDVSAEWWNAESNPVRGAVHVASPGLVAAHGPVGFDGVAYAAGVSANPDLVAVNRDPSDGGPPFQDASAQTYTGKAVLDTPAGDLKLVGGYRQIDTRNLLDLDGTPAAFFETGLFNDLDQLSVELNLSGTTIEDKFDYVIGATYFDEGGFDDSRSYNGGPFGPGPVGLGSTFRSIIDNSSWGIYAQGTYAMTDRLDVTAGIRYSEDTKGIISRNQGFTPSTAVISAQTIICQDVVLTPPECRTPHREAKFNDYSYTFGLNYQVLDDLMVYGKTSKGYRSGGHQLRTVGGSSEIPYDPEIVYEHELGFKGEFFENRFRLNAAFFYNTLSDFQRSVIVIGPAGNLTTVVQNAQKARNYGADMEFVVNLFEGFNINGGAAFIDQKYKEFTLPNLAGIQQDHTGENFIGIPETDFHIGADYRKDCNFATLAASVNYAWRDSYFNTQRTVTSPALGVTTQEEVDAGTAPAGGEVNARLSATFDENIEIALWGRNLADNRDRESCLVTSNFGRTVQCSFKEPRTVGVTATYNFGG